MNINIRRVSTIYDYSGYDTTKQPMEGERRYFDTILTGIVHPCSVLGDGSSQVDALPFLELINIETAVDINLEILKISGNQVFLRNTGGITINVNLGTAAVPDNYELTAGSFLYLRFESDWEIIDSSTKIWNFESLTVGTYTDFSTKGINVIRVNTAGGNVTINSLDDGQAGQPLIIYKLTPANNLVLKHVNGGTQDIYNKSGIDVTISGYGCVTLMCSGSAWFSSD